MSQDNIATAWCDLTGQLKPEQIEDLNSRSLCGQSGEWLLELAREYAVGNLNSQLHFGHLMEPAGALTVDPAGQTIAGEWIREFTGPEREVTQNDEIRIAVKGTQFTDGRIERYLEVMWRDQVDPVDVGSLCLCAADALRLAAALTEVANEIDLLTTETMST